MATAGDIRSSRRKSSRISSSAKRALRQSEVLNVLANSRMGVSEGGHTGNGTACCGCDCIDNVC